MPCAAHVLPHWLLVASLLGYMFATVAAAAIAAYLASRALDAGARIVHRIRIRRDVRRLDTGTCDGLRASRIRRLVDEHATTRRD